ncbi:unnamed protein product [Peniophora sp. CBMAI 1063]|nr:unnamed protein product [Peniophora sp. CBMAI 1063]
MSSTQIAQWMAKGWILTDQPCPSRGCGIPLLRSADGTVSFCVDCDKSPPTATSASAQSSTASMSDHPSRPSTPATSMSSTLSSPVFAPPVETEESLRRRQQSDRASAEMAKLLLKGWAMLADECPAASCPRIPLMRPPKAGGGKDPRKQCVCCGNWYIDEKDANGFERLVPVNQAGSTQMAGSSISITPQASSSSSKGKGVEREGASSVGPTPVPTVTAPSPEQRKPATLPQPDRSATLKPSATEQSPTNVQATVQALDATLGHLSTRLTSLTTQPLFDPSAVTATSQAITATAQALAELAKLQRSS